MVAPANLRIIDKVKAGRLAVVLPFTLTTTGTITATPSLAGAVPISFGYSAVLLGKGTLAGPAAITLSGSATISGGAAGQQTLSWSQVTGNEGYRVEWDTVTHASGEGLATAYANIATKSTNTTSHDIDVEEGTDYFWRVAALATIDGTSGVIQGWTAENSFTA